MHLIMAHKPNQNVLFLHVKWEKGKKKKENKNIAFVILGANNFYIPISV